MAEPVRYFEDFAPGMRFASTERILVTAAEIIDFAAAYDPQPFHTDPARADESVFGGLVASGWHTASLTMRLLVREGPRIAGGMVGIGPHELSWPRPVRPGDTLRLEAEILDAELSRSRPDRGWLRVRCLTLNQHGETVQLLVARVMAPRRPATE